jgi:hypothetical protein
MPYEIKEQLGLGMSAAEAVAAVSDMARALTDPYLPETICRVKQLYNVRTGKAVVACAKTPTGKTGGIGMSKAIPPLRGVVYAEQHPWVYPVGAAVAVGVPFLLGYLFGKR